MCLLCRPQLKEHSPLQSPNFNPQHPFNFDTPANQPVLRNVLNTNPFPGSAAKPLGMGNMANRRASFLNPSEPAARAHAETVAVALPSSSQSGWVCSAC
jgi:hypothetical protein